jgi:hypothetical protein
VSSGDLISTYSWQSTRLDVSGKPDTQGGFDVTLHLVAPGVDDSLSFNPRTADEQILPRLSEVFAQSELLHEVRGKLEAEFTPGSAEQAHWLDFQRGLFMATLPSQSVPEDACTFIHGHWHYCVNDKRNHCCIYDHNTACDLMCSLLG